MAVILGKQQCLFCIISKTHLTDLQDGEGWTPLHWAVNLNMPKFVQFLLQFGANPDEEDYEGQTPRSLASPDSEIGQIFKEIPINSYQGFGGCNFLGLCNGKPDQGLLPSKHRK